MKILILLLLTTLVNCATSKYGTAHTYLDGIKTEPIKPILEQSNLSLEIQTERITATYEEAYFLGIPIQDDTYMFPNIFDFSTKKSLLDFDGVTLGAAYQAQKKANADAIHLLKVTETSESILFPLYWKNSSQVTAYPLLLKSNSSINTTSKPSQTEDTSKKAKK